MSDDRISRRTFGASAAGLAILGATQASAKPTKPGPIPTGKPFILSTWDFGPGANAIGWPMLASGASALDVVEAAINHVELLGDYWVGAGGVRSGASRGGGNVDLGTGSGSPVSPTDDAAETRTTARRYRSIRGPRRELSSGILTGRRP